MKTIFSCSRMQLSDCCWCSSIYENCLFYKGEMFQYLGLSKLSLQELQGFSVSLLTVLQGGQLLLHLPLQHNTQQVSDQ